MLKTIKATAQDTALISELSFYLLTIILAVVNAQYQNQKGYNLISVGGLPSISLILSVIIALFCVYFSYQVIVAYNDAKTRVSEGEEGTNAVEENMDQKTALYVVESLLVLYILYIQYWRWFGGYSYNAEQKLWMVVQTSMVMIVGVGILVRLL